MMANKISVKGLKRIGKGYYPTAYGKGFQKKATVYLIDGKAYVKGEEYHVFKEGFIRVNYDLILKQFCQLSVLQQHEIFELSE